MHTPPPSPYVPSDISPWCPPNVMDAEIEPVVHEAEEPVMYDKIEHEELEAENIPRKDGMY